MHEKNQDSPPAEETQKICNATLEVEETNAVDAMKDGNFDGNFAARRCDEGHVSPGR